MLILKPPVWHQLDQAIEADPETQERWNRCKQKLKNGYKFTFNKKNYADKKEEAERNDGITVQPRLDYSNKSINKLHSVINKGLLYEQRRADKLEKKRPSRDDKKMIDTTRNITQAYIALANTTLQQEDNVEVFHILEDIATHLKSSNPPPGQDNSDDDDDSEH
jgi:hypothetical protein